MFHKIALLLAIPVVLYSNTTHIDLYPILLGAVQLCASTADLITTEMCFREGDIKGLPVYEANLLITSLFGRKPAITEFLLFDVCACTATYLLARCIKKTTLNKIWWIPQVTIIYSQIDQTIWNYRLYEKLHQAPLH